MSGAGTRIKYSIETIRLICNETRKKWMGLFKFDGAILQSSRKDMVLCAYQKEIVVE
ncbi:MAG: hypothetical protein ACI9DK_001655 [Vicingaceae bacterium]|jgi:hypothetical protein